MKKILLFLLLGVMLVLQGRTQIVDKKYEIDTVWNYPDLSVEKFSASPASVVAIFTMDTVVKRSYLSIIYKTDTIHFKATGVLDTSTSEDLKYYMERYTVVNEITNKEYKLNLMFYTKDNALTAIGIIDGKSMSVFSIKDKIEEINQ